MKRIRDHFRPRSPAPSVPVAECSRTSTNSDALYSVKKVLEVAEKAVDGLPIPGLKQAISIISTVLQSVEVRLVGYLRLG